MKRVCVLLLLFCTTSLAQKTANRADVVKAAWQQVDTLYVDMPAHKPEWQQAKTIYLGKRYRNLAVAHQAIREMLQPLKNSRLMWLSAADLKTILEQFSSPPPNLGLAFLSFEFLPHQKKVITALANSPAAGLVHSGDLLDSVNGTEVADMSPGELVRLLGRVGDKPAEFVVTRNKAPKSVTVKPASTPLQYVSWTGQPHGTVEISLREFTVPAVQEFREAMKEIEKLEPAEYTIDVRQNPGGLLDAALQIASLFISDKEFFCSKDASGETGCTKIKPGKPVTQPVTILVDQGTASAAEIFAIGFQRAGRGQVIGCRSYGHGYGAQVALLPDGSALLIPDSNYLDQQGQPVEGRGVTPDVVKCPAF